MIYLFKTNSLFHGHFKESYKIIAVCIYIIKFNIYIYIHV